MSKRGRRFSFSGIIYAQGVQRIEHYHLQGRIAEPGLVRVFGLASDGCLDD